MKPPDCLRPDCSLNFTSSQEVNFTLGVANTGLQRTGEVTLYNHYSVAMKGKDLSNIFSVSKNDVSSSQEYANAATGIEPQTGQNTMQIAARNETFIYTLASLAKNSVHGWRHGQD